VAKTFAMLAIHHGSKINEALNLSPPHNDHFKCPFEKKEKASPQV
jgi:hypothetical protein